MHDRVSELQCALESFPGGLSVLSPDLRVVFANEEARSALNLPAISPGMEPAVYDLPQLLGSLQAEKTEAIAAAIRKHLATATRRGKHRMRWTRPNGETVEVCSAQVAGGGFVTTYTDISARVRAEALLEGQARVLQQIAQGGSLHEVLESLMHLIEGQVDGIRSSLLLLDDGRRLRHGAAPTLDPEYCRLIDGVEIGRGVGSCGTAAFTATPVIVTDIANDPLWTDYKEIALRFGLRSCWSTPIFSATGSVLGTFAMYSDSVRAPTKHEESIVEVATRIAGIAIERKRIEERISYMATHDALTGLLNRTRLIPTIEAAMETARAAGRWISVVFVDLDNFKEVNDSLGHGAGDDLLKAVAQRMQASAGPNATVLRFGGDELVGVLADQPTSSAHVRASAERIRAAIAAPQTVAGRSISITSSIGVSTFPSDGTEAEMLIGEADAAMYRSKQHGRDRLSFCSLDRSPPARDEPRLHVELRAALANGEFQLHYQPQIDVVSGRTIGVEALIRWHHPARGLLSPAEFLAAADETGLIVPLGDWVLNEACRQAVVWQKAGFAPLRMCVNISARQVRAGVLVHGVAEALNGSGLDGRYLQLELTERALMDDPTATIATVKALQDMGVTIAIDDFGTGSFNLGTLQALAISSLKIDRSLVASISERSSEAVASAVVSLGRALGLAIIAEGVETQVQADIVARIGCNCAQGYLYSEPRPAGMIEAILPMRPASAEAAADRTLRGAA